MPDNVDRAGRDQAMLDRIRVESRVVYEGVSAYECSECGEEIPEGRRRAVPGVELCVDCKELEDSK